MRISKETTMAFDMDAIDKAVREMLKAADGPILKLQKLSDIRHQAMIDHVNMLERRIEILERKANETESLRFSHLIDHPPSPK